MPTLMDRTKAHPAVRAICDRHANRPDALLEILHDVQHQAGFISDGAVTAVADALNLSKAEVTGVVSFYHDFKRSPRRGVSVKLCRAEACQAVGAEALFQWAQSTFTPADGVEVEPVYCLGACALGPAALAAGKVHGRMTEEKLKRLVAQIAIRGAST